MMSDQKTINIILASAGVISALIGILVYLDSREQRKLQKDVLALDKELKAIQLSEAKR